MIWWSLVLPHCVWVNGSIIWWSFFVCYHTVSGWMEALFGVFCVTILCLGEWKHYLVFFVLPYCVWVNGSIIWCFLCYHTVSGWMEVLFGGVFFCYHTVSGWMEALFGVFCVTILCLGEWKYYLVGFFLLPDCVWVNGSIIWWSFFVCYHTVSGWMEALFGVFCVTILCLGEWKHYLVFFVLPYCVWVNGSIIWVFFVTTLCLGEWKYYLVVFLCYHTVSGWMEVLFGGFFLLPHCVWVNGSIIWWFFCVTILCLGEWKYYLVVFFCYHTVSGWMEVLFGGFFVLPYCVWVNWSIIWWSLVLPHCVWVNGSIIWWFFVVPDYLWLIESIILWRFMLTHSVLVIESNIWPSLVFNFMPASWLNTESNIWWCLLTHCIWMTESNFFVVVDVKVLVEWTQFWNTSMSLGLIF